MSAPVRFVQMPDGPKLFVKELNQEVGTFLKEPGGKLPALGYHVPLNMRGPYRLDQLPYKADLSTDALGYVLCQGFTAAGEKCSKRANNRSLRCDLHGGRLHPLDKLIKDNEDDNGNSQETQSLSRYRQFLAGQITVDDLDDEELATCGFRAKGGRIYKPRNVPREITTAFTKAIYERAERELRTHTVTAAQTVAEIMMNPKIESDIRLKAANTLLDRGLGKAPQTINHSVELTGFEQVFDGIFSGERERSRAGTVIDVEATEIKNSEQGFVDGYPVANLPERFYAAESSGGSEHVAGQLNSDGGEGAANDRLFARNPAILAQTVEIKPFAYDLSDHSQDVKKETRKRYAQRAADSEPPIPYVREQLPSGMFRHILPLKTAKTTAPKQDSKKKERKRYTLSDFT